MEQLMIPNGAVATPVQMVFLAFDGAETSYRNDLLTIEQVTVRPSGLTAAEQAAVCAELNALFGDGVIFVLAPPEEGEYSTVYIGRTDAFDAYGSFRGLSETVDAGNRNRSDNAFVNLDAGRSLNEIIEVAAHETGHLLGIAHDHSHGDLRDYACVVYNRTLTGLVTGTNHYISSSPNSFYNCGDSHGPEEIFSQYSAVGNVTISNGGIQVNRSAESIGRVNIVDSGYLTVEAPLTITDLTASGTFSIELASGAVLRNATLGIYHSLEDYSHIPNILGRTKLGAGCSAYNITLYDRMAINSGAFASSVNLYGVARLGIAPGGSAHNVSLTDFQARLQMDDYAPTGAITSYATAHNTTVISDGPREYYDAMITLSTASHLTGTTSLRINEASLIEYIPGSGLFASAVITVQNVLLIDPYDNRIYQDLAWQGNCIIDNLSVELDLDSLDHLYRLIKLQNRELQQRLTLGLINVTVNCDGEEMFSGEMKIGETKTVGGQGLRLGWDSSGTSLYLTFAPRVETTNTIAVRAGEKLDYDLTNWYEGWTLDDIEDLTLDEAPGWFQVNPETGKAAGSAAEVPDGKQEVTITAVNEDGIERDHKLTVVVVPKVIPGLGESMTSLFATSVKAFFKKNYDITVADAEVSLCGTTLKLSGLGVKNSFDAGKAEYQLKVTGTLEWTFAKGKTASIRLSGTYLEGTTPTNRYLGLNVKEDFSSYSLTVNGELEVPAFSFKGFSFSDLKITINTEANKFAGSGAISLPGIQYKFGGAFEIENGLLNKLTVTVDNLNIAIGSTGAFLQKVGGGFENIATDSIRDPMALVGQFGITYGPKITVAPIEVFGYNGGEYTLLSLEVGGSIAAERLKLDGEIKLLNDFLTGNGALDCDWSKGEFSIGGLFNIFGGAITVEGRLNNSHGNLTINGKGEVTVPDKFLFGPIAGKKFSGNVYLNLDPKSTSVKGCVMAWYTTTIFGYVVNYGFRYDFEKGLSLIGGNSVPVPSAPFSAPLPPDVAVDAAAAGGQWELSGSEELVLLSANWTGTGTVVLVDGNGVRYDAAAIGRSSFMRFMHIDEAGNVSYSTRLPTFAGGVTVAVRNPAAGIWSMEVAGVDNAEFSATNLLLNQEDGRFSITALSAADRLITVTGKVGGELGDDGVTVSIYADHDSDGYDGFLIGEFTAKQSSGAWQLTMPEGLQGGNFYLYAVTVRDGMVPIYSDYSHRPVAVGDRDLLPPEAPGNLSYSSSGSNKNRVYLDWDDAVDNLGVAFYEIRYAAAAEPNPDESVEAMLARLDDAGELTILSSDGPLSAAEVTGLENGSYYFQVRAVDGAGNRSLWSNAGVFEVAGKTWTAYNNLVVSNNRTLADGDSAEPVTVLTNGMFTVYRGGVARQVTINTAGHVNVLDGGRVEGATVAAGASLTVNQGGTALDVTQSAGGHLKLSVVDTRTRITGSHASGSFSLEKGVMSNFIFSSAGLVSALAGVRMVDVFFGANCSSLLSSGAVAENTVLSGGRQTVSGGASALNTSLTSASGYAAIQRLESGGYAAGALVNAGGSQFVSAGAVACDTVLSGTSASQTVSAGGTAHRTVVSTGARQTVHGFVSGNILRGGTATLYDGARADRTVISGGTMLISGSAQLNSTTVLSGGRLSASVAGAVLSDTVIKTGGAAYLRNTALAGTTVLDGGIFSIFGDYGSVSGGQIVINLDKYSLGATPLIQSIGLGAFHSFSCTINTGNNTTGSYYLSPKPIGHDFDPNQKYVIVNTDTGKSGTVSLKNNVLTLGGQIYTLELAPYLTDPALSHSLTLKIEHAPTPYKNLTVAGSFILPKGSQIVAATVAAGGRLTAKPESIVQKLVIESGGSARLDVHADCRGGEITVHAGGILDLDGLAAGRRATYNIGGRIVISSNGNCTDSSKINFLLNERGASLVPFIQNTEYIRWGFNNSELSVTVNAFQEAGDYILVNRVYNSTDGHSLDPVVTIRNAAGKKLGEVSRAGSFSDGFTTYELHWVNSGNAIISTPVAATKLMLRVSRPEAVEEFQFSDDAPTRDPVTVTPVFTAAAAKQQYSLDGVKWLNYAGDGVTVTENILVYFRAYDAGGALLGVSSYSVSNIDLAPPAAPKIETEELGGEMIVRAAFAADAVVKEYSLDGRTWLEYTGEFTAPNGAVVRFRSTDALGNTGLGYFALPDAPGSSPRLGGAADLTIDGDGDFLVDYPVLSTALLTPGDGFSYTKVEITRSGRYAFRLSGDATGGLTLYAAAYDKAGNEIAPKRLAAGQTEAAGLLEPGTYYLAVKAGKTDAWFDLTMEAELFRLADPDDNRFAALAEAYQLTPGSRVRNAWVGYGDPIDYRQLTLQNAGSYTFAISKLSSQVRLTVYTVDAGGIKLKKLQSVNASTQEEIRNLSLAAGTCFISIEALGINPAKALSGGTTYELNITGDEFTGIDLRDNSYLRAASFGAAGGAIAGWVGFGDTVDYHRLAIDQAGSYQFTVSGIEPGAQVKMSLVAVSGGKEKVLDQLTVKTDSGLFKQPALLAPADGTAYFLRLESLNAAKGFHTAYQVAVEATLFGGVDRSNDTPGTATALAFDTALPGWLGPGDEVDYYSFAVTGAADCLLTLAATARDAKLELFRLQDGAPVKLAYNLKNGLLLHEGDYLVKVAGKQPGAYTLTLAQSNAFRSFAPGEAIAPGERYSFTLDAFTACAFDSVAGLTLYADNGANGRTPVKLKADSPVVLAPGTYYLTATAKAAPATMRIVDAAPARYENALITDDNNWRSAAPLAAGGWVGYGDAADVYRLTVSGAQAGSYVIMLTDAVAGHAGLTLYRGVTDAAGQVTGVVKVSSITVTDKKNSIAVTDLLAGQYFIAVHSTAAGSDDTAKNTAYGLRCLAGAYTALGREAVTLAKNQYASFTLTQLSRVDFTGQAFTLYGDNGAGGMKAIAVAGNAAVLAAGTYYVKSTAESNPLAVRSGVVFNIDDDAMHFSPAPGGERLALTPLEGWIGLGDAADDFFFHTFAGGAAAGWAEFAVDRLTETLTVKTGVTLTLYEEVNGAWKKVAAKTYAQDTAKATFTAGALGAALKSDSCYKLTVSTADGGKGGCNGAYVITGTVDLFDFGNNSIFEAEALAGNKTATVAKKGDAVDFYDLDEWQGSFHIELETGSVRLTFYDEQCNAVKVSGVRQADGSLLSNQSALNLTAGHGKTGAMNLALDDAIRFVRVEAAGAANNRYALFAS